MLLKYEKHNYVKRKKYVYLKKNRYFIVFIRQKSIHHGCFYLFPNIQFLKLTLTNIHLFKQKKKNATVSSCVS